MLTGQLRNDIDKLWEKFWTGGIANPLTVIEQISYLIFARMLDMYEETNERKAARTQKDYDRLFPSAPEGQLLRWKNFKNLSGKELHKHLKNEVYPYFASLGQHSEEEGLGRKGTTTHALGHIGEYMQDADLEIKNESVLVSAVEMVDSLPLTQSDVKGDIYEYLLSKLTNAGINGQFRTPRHIIDAMIELIDPQPTDIICDPSCGTAGFLARTMEYLNKTYSSESGTFTDEEGNLHYTGDLLEPYREHINKQMFWGFDFDTTMLRVSSMNMMLHGVNGANILYQDSLNKSVKEHYPEQEEDFFDVVLANPPFKGSLDETNTNPDVLGLVKTKKTELLFVAHILRSLKLGGRAAVIVPDGVLFGSSKAHQQLRKELIENNQLEGIVSLPSGVFKPYAGVSTAILIFTKGGTTERVWFYDLQADDTAPVARWIERFADVCKELGKYQEKLNGEYAQRWEQANELGEENESGSQRLTEGLERVEADTASIDQRNTELDAAELRLAKTKSEFLDKERSLKQREANAEAGFVEQKELALRQLEQQQREQTKQKDADLQQLQDQKRSVANEVRQAEMQLAEIKHSCSEAEAERINLLDQREQEISQARAKQDRDRSRLEREWSDLKAAEAAIQEQVAAEMQRERAGFEAQLSKISGHREKAWTETQELKDRLCDLQELSNALGERTPDEILDSLDNLQAENKDLKRKLELAGTAELQRDGQYLRDKVADLERDLGALRPELDEARRELSVKRVAATELEAIGREKRVLESHKNTLSVHIDDLESRIDQLTNAQKAKTSFPAMSQMDSERKFQASIELEHVPDLKIFADELQHRIARAEKNVELFYPIEDIRRLLGGLAMSQLHVFQGISGTGKTSLAKAFSKAMGGFCQDIAVQAGWRDRDDLLGHFNAFERRFYEKDCLQALYQSQTPRWNDTCNVILLDEMNLSRPEQYFAEFLSALEKNSSDERVISLSETALPGAPKMLRDGRQIWVPDNVWFIGTANHDETTNELADKTYDRSHVMTLPKQDHRFEIKDYQPASFSFKSLQDAFDKACKEHVRGVRSLLEELTDSEFTSQLENDFGLGWGNRFEKQALRFVPVMLATGATKGDALDHLLATRVMRQGKVTGRFDVTGDSLRKLMGTLEAFWNQAKLESLPEKSLELLEKDIKRKEGGF